MDHVFYYRCPYHRLRFVLSICLAFAKEEDVYQVALSYPYSYTRMKERLNFYEILTSKCNEGREYFGLTPSSQERRSRGSRGTRNQASLVSGSTRTSTPATSTSRNSSGKTLFPIFDSPSSCIVFRRETHGRTLVSVKTVLPFSLAFKIGRNILFKSFSRLQ